MAFELSGEWPQVTTNEHSSMFMALLTSQTLTLNYIQGFVCALYTCMCHARAVFWGMGKAPQNCPFFYNFADIFSIFSGATRQNSAFFVTLNFFCGYAQIMICFEPKKSCPPLLPDPGYAPACYNHNMKLW